MKKVFLNVFAVATISCLFSASCMPVIGDSRIQLGIEHYESKRYTEALGIFNELASKGNDDASLYLGIMYRDGLGVEKDLSKSAGYFKRVKNQESANYRAEAEKLYLELIDVAASHYESYEYKDALGIYRQIPENFYRGIDFNNLGDMYRDVNFFPEYDLEKSKNYYEKALDENFRDGVVGLYFIKMMSENVDEGFNNLVDYYKETGSDIALQAIIDSPVLKEWNYIGVTNDDIVLASRDVMGTDIKKIWTYYFPKRKVSSPTKELTYYKCAEKVYAIHSIVELDEHDMPKDVFHETNIDLTYKPIVPGTIGENLYNYACFSVKKAKARK